MMPVKSSVVMGGSLGVAVKTSEVCWGDVGVGGNGETVGVWEGGGVGLAGFLGTGVADVLIWGDEFSGEMNGTGEELATWQAANRIRHRLGIRLRRNNDLSCRMTHQ